MLDARAQSDLEKKRNDEETEEGWVQCDHCNDEDMPYICPMCLLDGAPRAAYVTPFVHPV